MEIYKNIRACSWLVVVLIALPSLAIAGDKGSGKGKGRGSDNGVRYYLSLGTSLSVGVQPDANGVNQLTDEGYADQLLYKISPGFRKIKLVKLGCPGETTQTMIGGGICDYDEGSQLAEVLEFLRAHKNKVALVTIDLGVNDVLSGRCIVGFNVDQYCLQRVFIEVQTKLDLILAELHDAASPSTRIVGMNYYNSFLASWLLGTEGQAFSVISNSLAVEFNMLLMSTYDGFGIPVADVAGAYNSGEFDNSIGPLPLNVATLCEYTYMCNGQANIHANSTGYNVIAEAIVEALEADVSAD